MYRPPMYVVDLNNSVKNYVGEFAKWHCAEFKNGLPIDLLKAVQHMNEETGKFLEKRTIR